MSHRYSPPLRVDPIGGVRARALYLAAHTAEKTTWLAVEFGCELSGDEFKFF
jgi:hypothetical protein